MKSRLPALVTIVAALCHAPLAAYEFGQMRAGWAVVGTDDGCGMTMEFEGPGTTNLTFIKKIDGRLFLGATNSEWSARDGESYNISFGLNGSKYAGASAQGFHSSGQNGFISSFAPGFERDFRAGTGLTIYLDDTRIDDLSLSGTNAAMDVVNRCLAGLRAELAATAREKRRWSDLPKDPFQKPAAPPQPISAMPLGNPANWATTNDYPAAALRESRSGKARFKLLVGRDGRPSRCEITETSGHADLDATTCTLVMRRARFRPATDVTGNVAEGWYENVISWAIPKEEPPPPPPITCVAGQVCTRP